MISNINIWSINLKLFRLFGRNAGALFARVAAWMLGLVNTAAYPTAHYGFNYIPLEHTDECPG